MCKVEIWHGQTAVEIGTQVRKIAEEQLLEII